VQAVLALKVKAFFVEKIEGCQAMNVIGLSLLLLRQMLGKKMGYEQSDFFGNLNAQGAPVESVKYVRAIVEFCRCAEEHR